MKTLQFAALSLAAAMMATGCSTVYRVSEVAPAGGVSQKAESAVALRSPAASVKIKAKDAQAKIVAEGLKIEIENGLSARGFDVAAKTPADSSVSISLSCRRAAKLDEWRAYEGRMDARVTEAATGRLLGAKSFTVAGERALDESKALDSVKSGLYRQLSPWLSKVMVAKPLPLPPGAAVAHIAITPADMSEDQSNVLAVQRSFMDAVQAHQGVISCRLAQAVPSQRKYVFFVQYDAAAFPGGLLNTLVLDNPRLGGGVKLEIAQ